MNIYTLHTRYRLRTHKNMTFWKKTKLKAEMIFQKGADRKNVLFLHEMKCAGWGLKVGVARWVR